MLTVVAIVLAVLVLPSPWGAVAVVGAALVDVGETAFLIRRARSRPSVVGSQALVGREAVVAGRLDPEGRVRLDGESWAAVCVAGGPLDVGRRAEVVGVDGLLLVVRAVPVT